MNPIILYDNRFLDGALTATDTADGFHVDNIKDRNADTFWKAASYGTKYITKAPLAKGTVTLANMRLSLVDGAAFVDFSAPDILTDYIGKRLVIIDSAGKKAIGYIKAAGTGETYLGNAGNELFLTDLSGWTKYERGGGSVVWNGASDVLITQGGGSSANSLVKALSTTAGKTYHVKVVISSVSSGNWCEVLVGTSPESGNIYNSGYGGARTIVFEFVATGATTYISMIDVQSAGHTSHWASCQVYQNLVSNGQFSSDTTGWSAFYGRSTIASIAGGYSGNCLEITKVLDATQYVYQNFTGVPGALFLFSRYLKSGTSGNEQSYAGIYTTNVGALLKNIIANSTASWVENNFKWVADRTGLSIGLAKTSSTAGTMLFDEVILKQVITPSATGVTIVSTPGGATYNWESIESGFNYNDVSGYVYKISESDACDGLFLFGHNLGTAEASVSVESSDDETNWTERLAAFTPSDDRAIMKLLTSFRAASKRLKIVSPSVAPYIAEAILGNRLEMPYPPDAPMIPYEEGIESEMTLSRGGRPLGVVTSYFPIDIQHRFSNLLRTWVTDNFVPFWEYAKYFSPFAYAPDLDTWPDDVFFCTVSPDMKFRLPVSILLYVDYIDLIMRGYRA